MPRNASLSLVFAAVLMGGTVVGAHAQPVFHTTHNYARPIIHNYAHHYRYHAPRSYHRRHHYGSHHRAPRQHLYRYPGFHDPYYGGSRRHYRHGRHFNHHRRYGHGYGYGFGYRLPGLSLHYRTR